MSTLIDRLRDIKAGPSVKVACLLDGLCQEAADAIERKDAELAKLRAALKQISDDAENLDIGHRDFRINARHHADDALRNEQ